MVSTSLAFAVERLTGSPPCWTMPCPTTLYPLGIHRSQVIFYQEHILLLLGNGYRSMIRDVPSTSPSQPYSVVDTEVPLQQIHRLADCDAKHISSVVGNQGSATKWQNVTFCVGFRKQKPDFPKHPRLERRGFDTEEADKSCSALGRTCYLKPRHIYFNRKITPFPPANQTCLSKAKTLFIWNP